MADDLQINVNGSIRLVASSPDTPLLYVLMNELQLKGPRFGCGLAQCGSCSVLLDGVWASYPIMRFAEHPNVTPTVVQRIEEPSTGAGEETMGAVASAIANAFFDATGMRLRQYPMAPERVLAGLNASRT